MIAFLIRRLGWMAAGAGARYVAKRGVQRSIDDATSALEERLPEPVAKIADKLPGDIVRTGAAVTVAGRGAARTGRGVTTATKAAARLAPHVDPRNRPRPVRSLADKIDLARSNVREQTEVARREYASDYARHTEGDAAALEALLDLRDVEETPIPEMPDPINSGRRRFRPALPKAPVNRVQRSYRQKPKPWDSPTRTRSKDRGPGAKETDRGDTGR